MIFIQFGLEIMVSVFRFSLNCAYRKDVCVCVCVCVWGGGGVWLAYFVSHWIVPIAKMCVCVCVWGGGGGGGGGGG